MTAPEPDEVDQCCAPGDATGPGMCMCPPGCDCLCTCCPCADDTGWFQEDDWPDTREGEP